MIFVDTSFWIALTVQADRRHPEAAKLFASHSGTSLSTSNLICGETWTFARRRFGHGVAVELIDRLERTPRVHILRVGSDEERDAWEWLRRHDEREYSYVDATSFALMKRNAISCAFAFDDDFAAAGFVEVRP